MRFRGLLLVAFTVVTAALAGETEELPSGLPPTTGDERVKVLQLMKDNKEKYGADAALMQGLLLTHSLQGDAVLTSESTIVGFEEDAGVKYVAFRVNSGVIFNDKHLGREQRLERIWHVVLERTLLRYPTFTAPADGLAVEIQYTHRPYDSVGDLYREPENTGPVERVKFYMASPDVSAFVEHRLGAQEFLERARILVDDQPVKLSLLEVVMPATPVPARSR
ncbi:MAG: hypothetical protein ACREQQ_14480 [Candidatus Binatia bacterium]